MAAGAVSDEVWAQLDPRAGRLSRRGRLALAGATALTAAAVVAGYALLAGGTVWPRLSVESDWSGHFSPGRHNFSETLTIDNDGWAGARIVSVGAPRGLRVTGVDGLDGEVGAGGSAALTVHYLVTDCARPPAEPVTLLLHVDRWWGTATVRLRPPDQVPSLITPACTGSP